MVLLPLLLLLLCVAILMLLHLLLFVMACQMEKLLLWFIESVISVFSFSSFKHNGFFHVPPQYTLAVLCRVYGLDLSIVQPRELRVCAQPRRASARRGEAPLVNICKNRHVGHVVSAIEKSDSDQVLSRKRPSSR